MTSISTPCDANSSSSGSAPAHPPRRASAASGCRRLGAPEHRLGPAPVVDQAQAPAAAREQVLDQLLEVALGGLERLLEGRVDLAVGLADQALELRERRLEVGALGLEALDVLERLLVLALGQRVDRAELLAPARRRRSSLRLDLEPLGVVERPRSRRPSSRPSVGADPLELGGRLGAAVAEVGDPDLGLGDRLAGGRAAAPGARPPRASRRAGAR